LFLPFIF